MDNRVNIVNLYKEIKGHVILKNINISMHKGKIYGFIGYNGSGKSMLFKAICGFIKPSNGEIILNGKILGKDMDFPDNLGALIEHPGFLPELSGFQNLKFLSKILNIITDDDIEKTLTKVGLDPSNQKKVRTYSLGMKQRLGIAQAIMENPDVLILDEPMNGLDKEGVRLVRDLLLELKKDGKTILLSSHMSEDIEILCDHVWEMDHGNAQQLK